MSASSTPLLTIPPFSTTSTPRLQALYSDFARQKHSNPDSYHANIAWWQDALCKLLWSGFPIARGTNQAPDRLILSGGRDLVESLRMKGVGRPLSIGTVVAESALAKSLIPVDQFLSSKQSIYDPGWLGVRVVKYLLGKPLWWALESIGVVGEESGLQTDDTRWWGDYVVFPLVERAADAVEKKQWTNLAAGPSGSLYTLDGFRREFGDVLAPSSRVMSESDAKVLVRYLERDRSVAVVEKDIIKFVFGEAKEHRRITAVDQGILELKTAIQSIQLNVESIQRKIEEHMQKAVNSLRNAQKSVALGHLKLKRQLEDILIKALESLHTLEGTLINVEGAAGNIRIMKSYESSAATLKMILSHPSLQRDKIDLTMEALAVANEDAREVDQIIRDGAVIASGTEALEADVEAELSALVEEIKTEEAAKASEAKKLGDLLVPLQVPQDRPREQTPEQILGTKIASAM